MYTILMFGTAQAGGLSLFQGCPYFRDVLISGVSLFQGCPYFRGVLISGGPYFVFLFGGVLIGGFHCRREFSSSIQGLEYQVVSLLYFHGNA